MMGLTESARHLPPLGTEEALRPLSRRSAECRHVFDSDTAPCHFDAGFATGCVLVASSPAFGETAWPVRGL